MEKGEDCEQRGIVHIQDGQVTSRQDSLAREEPLEIRLGLKGEAKSLSITMRTPGADRSLALGFLVGEGILSQPSDVTQVVRCGKFGNVVRVELSPSASFDPEKLKRHFYTTSSCGVCGKSSLEALHTERPRYHFTSDSTWDTELLSTFPEILFQQQSVFHKTGGLHAAGLFNRQGKLLKGAEDVGRHNALDKVLGWAWENLPFPLEEMAICLSGRASFELVQKAAMSGVRVIVAVGAPSTLAVQTAEECGISLLGFTSEKRCNVYSEFKRIHVGGREVLPQPTDVGHPVPDVHSR